MGKKQKAAKAAKDGDVKKQNEAQQKTLVAQGKEMSAAEKAKEKKAKEDKKLNTAKQNLSLADHMAKIHKAEKEKLAKKVGQKENIIQQLDGKIKKVVAEKINQKAKAVDGKIQKEKTKVVEI